MKYIDETIQNSLTQANSVSELWSLLFKHGLFNLYSEIIAAGIYPTSRELNEIQYPDNVSAWHWLARKDVDIPVFQDLLNKGIWPNAMALSACHPTDNTNVWSNLHQGINVFLFFRTCSIKALYLMHKPYQYAVPLIILMLGFILQQPLKNSCIPGFAQ